MQVESVTVERLVPYARNARTHSDEQVAQIAGSIREFGWTNPVLLDEEGSIIAGHGRVLAARKLGLAEVPAIVLSHLTAAQKRALRLADNKLALNAGWDGELLGLELRDLKDLAYDLELIGFSEDELGGLLAGADATRRGLAHEDEIPEAPAEPVARPGDLWLCGEHRVLCGDAADMNAIDRALGGTEPDLLIYDPPYDDGAAWTLAVPAPKALVFTDYRHLREAMRVAEPYEHVYQFIWDGVSSFFTHNRPLARHKTCLYCAHEPEWNFDDATYPDDHNRTVKDVSSPWGNYVYRPLDGATHLQTVYQEANNRIGGGNSHAKPLRWVRALMAGAGGEVVLDQFAGSGTSLVAAPPGVRVAAIEIVPAMVDVIVRRWEAASGGSAQRL